MNPLLDLFSWEKHKIQDTTLIVGGAATRADVIASSLQGNWLATHGIGALTWVEIIQIIGAIGVLVAIFNALFRAALWIFQSRKKAI